MEQKDCAVNMNIVKLWAMLFIFFLACSCINEASSKKIAKADITAVFHFGDSIVDPGNNNLLPTIAKANYPPYGKDFINGQPTGRFSNGFVPSDLVVQELGIKELLPAYLDPNLQDEDLFTGVNFASGASGYDPLSSELSKLGESVPISFSDYIQSVISLSKQIEMFEAYQTRLTQLTGDEERTNAIVRGSFCLAVTGSNDITNTYFITPFRKSHYDIPSYTDFMVSYASIFIRDLYRVGARKIGIIGIPAIGCVPSQRTLKGGPERNCVETYNDMARLFNSKLSSAIDSLSNEYADAFIVYIDMYDLFLDIIDNYENYGFKESTLGCCGTGKIEVTELCNKFSPTCANTSEYIFWDSFHPTERTYRIIVPMFLKNFVSGIL